jgi:pentatricopeptide repeat protein
VVGGDDALDVARRYVGIMEMLQLIEERDMTTTSKHEQCNSSEYLFAEYGNEGFDNVEGNNEDGTSSYEEGWDTYDKNTRISMTTSAPNIVTYNCLLSIAARLERPEAVEEILDRMIERYSSGKSQVKPNRISFNTVCVPVSVCHSQHRLESLIITHIIVHHRVCRFFWRGPK